MYEEKSEQTIRVMVVLDISLTIFAFLLSYLLRNVFSPDTEASFFSHVALLPLIIVLLIIFISYFGAYKIPRTASIFSYGWAIVRGVTSTIVVLLTLLFLLKIQYVSRSIVVIFAGLDVIVLILARGILVSYFRRFAKDEEKFLKVLIIGTGYRAKHLSETLRQQTEWGVDIIGYLDPDASRVGSSIIGTPVLGTIEDISFVLKEYVVDEVIIAIPRAMIEDAEEIAFACEEEGIKLRLMADVYRLQVARWSMIELGDIPLMTIESVALDEAKLLIKRILDLTFTLLSMPVVLPLMGIIAIAIKFDSRGPVFFFQKRVGLRKRIFPMIKFRSMHVGSEEKLQEIEHLNEAEGPIFKIADDPRVTRVGRFIRRTSLDEFPQLFNVIAGQMSLVGPRPMSIRDVDLFDKGIQRKRFSVKPGCTCIWQISGRSNLPFSKWIELDLEYIENWSLLLDIKILLKTPFVLLKGTGAV